MKIIMFQGILGKSANIKFSKNLFIVAHVFTGRRRACIAKLLGIFIAPVLGQHKMGTRFCKG
jgi:hypothetical protein